MKISKEKLLRIIKEECNQAMNAPVMASSGMAMDYLDQEGEMAKRQLSQIAEYAAELDQMLMDDTQLEAWVQAKLTKAADYIKTVKHYVEYGMEEGAYDQVNGEMVSQEEPMAINTPEMIEVGPDFEEKY
tara:strand:- start:728 stop:1117 length:390 start_codon:yes stop_codon:yes gene_type:complete